MMSRVWPAVAAAALLVFSGSAVARNARSWLLRIQQAARTENYTGIFVYHHGPVLAVMSIVHRVSHGHVSERLTALSGRRQIIVRSAGRIACYIPRRRIVYIERQVLPFRSIPVPIPAHLGPLRRYYRISIGGVGRVAGHYTRLVTLAPLDRYRYGYRLWAARKTGLLLKASVINWRGRRIEQFVFTRLVVRSQIPKAAIGPVGLNHVRTYKEEQSALYPDLKLGWTVTRLPPGFHLVIHLKQGLAGRLGIVQHLVYSDGLAVVSVLIASARVNGFGPPSLYRLGALHIFRCVFHHHTVTVLGDVPTSTVEMMALSVHRLGGSLRR